MPPSSLHKRKMGQQKQEEHSLAYNTFPWSAGDQQSRKTSSILVCAPRRLKGKGRHQVRRSVVIIYIPTTYQTLSLIASVSCGWALMHSRLAQLMSERLQLMTSNRLRVAGFRVYGRLWFRPQDLAARVAAETLVGPSGRLADRGPVRTVTSTRFLESRIV